MKNVLKQLGKMVCYVGLYFGMQFAVMFAMMFGYIILGSFKMGMQGMQGITDANAFAQQIATDAEKFIMSNVDLQLVIATVISLLILWAFYGIRKKKVFQEIQLRKFPVKAVAPSLVIAVGGWLFITFGMQVLPIPDSLMESYNEMASLVVTTPGVIMVLSTVFAAPIIEEITFRGLSLSRLRRAMPTWAALLIVSVVFGLMHTHPLWIAYATILGVMFGVVAVYTESIGASILTHMLFNFLGSIVSMALPDEVDFTIMVICTVAGAAVLAAGVWWLIKVSPRKSVEKVGANLENIANS